MMLAEHAARAVLQSFPIIRRLRSESVWLLPSALLRARSTAILAADDRVGR